MLNYGHFEFHITLQGNASSYSALGLSRHLVGDVEGAIEYYHQALSRKPDDPFSSEMLNRALEEALENDKGQLSLTGATNESLSMDAPPMTPADHSSMSMGSTMSGMKFHGNNGMLITGNGRSFFSPADSDVDMSMS